MRACVCVFLCVSSCLCSCMCMFVCECVCVFGCVLHAVVDFISCCNIQKHDNVVLNLNEVFNLHTKCIPDGCTE